MKLSWWYSYNIFYLPVWIYVYIVKFCWTLWNVKHQIYTLTWTMCFGSVSCTIFVLSIWSLYILFLHQWLMTVIYSLGWHIKTELNMQNTSKYFVAFSIVSSFLFVKKWKMNLYLIKKIRLKLFKKDKMIIFQYLLHNVKAATELQIRSKNSCFLCLQSSGHCCEVSWT